MNKKLGFIGCGKMAQAMIKGILASGIVTPEQIMISTKTDATRKSVQEKYSVQVGTNTDVARWSQVLFLAIKPDIHREVLQEIKNVMTEDKIVITVAAGISLQFLEQECGEKIKAIRSMPNTPSFVGEGMSAICINEHVTKADVDIVLELFRSFGQAELVHERLMDSIPAISGSSPAYVFMFIEALADGGVKNGIPRDQAYRFAAQAVLGAAKMVLETGKHPGALKDEVCTPGGATIEAVSALEQNGFRASVLHAMEKCTEKTKKL